MDRARVRQLLLGGALVALIANLLVFGVFAWSREGQRTVVTVQRQDGAYRIEIDGNAVLPHTPEGAFVPVDAPPQGTLTLGLPVGASALPRPSGIDSIVVRDANGNVLLQDDFDFFNVANWRVVSGSFDVEDGVISAKQALTENTLEAREMVFGDVKVEVTYRNNRGGTIGMHVTESGGAYYHFDLQRDFANFMDVFRDGVRTATPYGGFVRPDGGQALRSIASMASTPYPYILLALAAGLLLTLALSEAESRLRSRRASGPPRLAGSFLHGPGGGASSARLPLPLRLHPATVAVALLALAVFVATRVVMERYYGEIPHVPDETTYIFGAKLLTAGKAIADMPQLHDLFYFYWPPFLYERDGMWGSGYPFGHPLTLAAGEVVGALPIVPALVGAASVFLMYAVGRRMYGVPVGVLAALLTAASPFFLMQASTFMSHTTCAMYTLLSLLFILKRDRPLPYGFLAGAFFGLALNTRTLDMAALIAPFGVLLLSYALSREGRRDAILHIGGFALGGLLLLGAMGVYTNGLTGEPFGTAYAQGDTSELLGFKNGHTLGIGIKNEQAQMIALIQVFNGWPAVVGLGFVLAPFLLGTRNRWDYFCLVCALAVMLVYLLYRYSGVYAGPRYWFEATPFLLFLTARGVEMLGTRLSEGAALVRRRMGRADTRPTVAGYVPAYALIGVLMAIGGGGWLLNQNDPQDLALVPYQASDMKYLFDTDDRLARLADETELHDALVLVKPCGYYLSAHCYGSVFIRNNITFDGDVVWMRYEEGRVAEAVAAYPGRTVYVANWEPEASIEPYDPRLHR